MTHAQEATVPGFDITGSFFNPEQLAHVRLIQELMREGGLDAQEAPPSAAPAAPAPGAGSAAAPCPTPGGALREAVGSARNAAECEARVRELLRRPEVRAAVNQTARPCHERLAPPRTRSEAGAREFEDSSARCAICIDCGRGTVP